MIAPAIDAAQPVQYTEQSSSRQESIKEDILHVYINQGRKLKGRALAKYVLNHLWVSISHHTVDRLIERFYETGEDIRATVADRRAKNAPSKKAKEYEEIAMQIVHSYVYMGHFYKEAHALMEKEAPLLGITKIPTLSQVYNLNRHIPKCHRPEVLRNAKAAADMMRSEYPKRLYRVDEKWCSDETSFVVKDYVSNKEFVVLLSLTFDVETGFMRPFHYKLADKFDKKANSTERVKAGWTSADAVEALYKAVDKNPKIHVHNRKVPEGLHVDQHPSHRSDAFKYIVRKMVGPNGKPIKIDYSVGEEPRTNGVAERSIGYFKYQFLRGFLELRDRQAKQTKNRSWTTSLSFLPILLEEAARRYNQGVKTGRVAPRCEEYGIATENVNSRIDWNQVDLCCRDFQKDVDFSNEHGIKLADGNVYKAPGMYIWSKMKVWVAYRPGRYNPDVDIFEPAGSCKEPKHLGTLYDVRADSGELKAKNNKVSYRNAKMLHEGHEKCADVLAQIHSKITPAPSENDQEKPKNSAPMEEADTSIAAPSQSANAEDSETTPKSGQNNSSPASNVIQFQQPSDRGDAEDDNSQPAEEETQQTPTTATTRTRRKFKSAKI